MYCLLILAPDAPVIDLLHTAPRFDVRASAHLLAAYVSAFPLGSIFLGVVDPGVGNAQRRPVVMKIAQHWFVGPDNGLFQVLAARAAERQAEIECWEINWRPENLSNTFHGRDVFAPVAARLARGELPPGTLFDCAVSTVAANDLPELIYIDHFGNAVTGLRAHWLDKSAQLQIGKNCFTAARLDPQQSWNCTRSIIQRQKEIQT